MEERRRKHGWAVWCTVAVLLPVLYVASIGPVCRASLRPDQTVVRAPRFYWPIGWAVRRSRTTDECMRRYVRLWLPNLKFVVISGVPHEDPDWTL